MYVESRSTASGYRRSNQALRWLTGTHHDYEAISVEDDDTADALAEIHSKDAEHPPFIWVKGKGAVTMRGLRDWLREQRRKRRAGRRRRR